MARRIWDHPILDFERGEPLKLIFEGREITAYPGESVAAALVAEGVDILGWSKLRGRPRGFFCGIGKCSSCLMVVDGIPNTRTCVTPVSPGMRVSRQRGPPPIPDVVPEFDLEREEVDLAILGGGPAGLSAAIAAADLGASVLLVDENFRPGGQLIKQTHKFFGSRENYAGVRGIEIARRLLSEVGGLGARWVLRSSAVADYPTGSGHRIVVRRPGGATLVDARAVIVGTGASENMLAFPNNDLPGVYGAGGLQTLMNVFGVLPGERALVIGAGNVGLIVAYQLLQAGARVEAVVEIMPRIGGYFVHAAKIRRMGVPILLRHTISRVLGRERVEGAEVVAVDDSWRAVEGSERTFDVDMVVLAVGLTPSVRIPAQAGADMIYVPQLGGHVPVHTPRLLTTLDGMYVAGDSSGIEEATTAMLEGRIAGAAAASDLGYAPDRAERVISEAQRQLESFRSGPFSSRVLEGKEMVWEKAREVIG